MKLKLRYDKYDQTVEKEVNYIPVRYILITLVEAATIIGIVAACKFLHQCYKEAVK